LGFGLFLFWPTAVPKLPMDGAAGSSVVGFLKSVDATGNACPSLHVAFSVLTAVWLQRLLRYLGAPHWLRALNWLWCLGILYSTLATKQHVAIDLYAGVALGLAVALLRPRPEFSLAPMGA
jgi:membrane-associated phospholipid phosphatase